MFYFKPPFGPFPVELTETFPIGQSEIPDFDKEMVRTGCIGIARLMETNPDSHFTIRCRPVWKELICQILPTVEVQDEGS